MATTLEQFTIPNAEPVQPCSSAAMPCTQSFSSPCPTLDRLMLAVVILCFILMAANMLFDLLSVIWLR